MSATKGSAKTGGREKGSKNKVVAEVKARLTDIVAKYVLTTEGVRTLEADLETLRPVDRVAMVEKLMKYCLPTLGTLSLKDDDGEPVTINVRYTKTEAKVDDDVSDLDYSEADDLPEDDDEKDDDDLPF